ncbi:unnamed protein product [Allacma fusca]|uniref:Uncharacterized protein n=1 Tax=Allacma fusca TaxID=39272 RepID=A0A8J2JNH7_9HEXA|nr:unnamed protein product [Allacma fusca]
MTKIITESSKLTSMRYDSSRIQVIVSFLVVLFLAFILTTTVFVAGEDTDVLKHPKDEKVMGKEEKECLYAYPKGALILAYFAFGMSNAFTVGMMAVGALAGSRCFAIWVVSNAFIVCNATFTVLWGTPTLTYVFVIGCVLTAEGTTLWIIGPGGFDIDKEDIKTWKTFSTESLESSGNLQLETTF